MDRVLITGGAGFLGKHLIKKLLDKYSDIEIRSISRHENEIVEMLVACNNNSRLKPIIGDIKEVDTLGHVLKDVDTVIHLAAMKHIDFCELYPSEAISVNIIATMNLLELFSGDTFIGMSTDKAVEATGCYGATKLLLEKLVLEQARKEPERRYMVVRSGNIFGSSGSVIQRWRQEIKQSNKITITDLEMTRFFIGVNALVAFIIQVIEQGESGKIYIPFQKVAKLGDLVKAMVELYGDKKTKIEVVGLRGGEKMHERLLLPWQKEVVSDLTTECSEDGEVLSIEEIKDWLADY
ncbi:MAG: NAD-dependent epimerase/dehydratase family protein [Chloroflexi bacterium]|nr:NAD-dependent epimerase/dehydratase family protein [Chloroflexota bacterium]